MIYLILLWFPFAAFADYMLSVRADQMPNFSRRALYHLITWPNVLMGAAQALYGRNAYRFPKIMAFANWLKS